MSDAYYYIIIFFLVLLVILLLRSVLKTSAFKRKQKRKMALGKRLEKKARRFLKHNGFKQIEYQKQFTYYVKEAGDLKKITLIPDYVALKGGDNCIIEVKSGVVAPFIRNEATRRQLLEYHHVIKPERLYLLDITLGKLKLIEF